MKRKVEIDNQFLLFAILVKSQVRKIIFQKTNLLPKWQKVY